MILYHGTTLSRARAIIRDGFTLPSYVAPDIEDATYYAACGGEWDLQEREEAYEAEHGDSPRERYDFWEMARLLYPKGDMPAIVTLDVPDELARTLLADSGAKGALTIKEPLMPACFSEVLHLTWDADDNGPPCVDALPAMAP